MPVIIAATDFSAIGDNAVQYAAGLASHWGYSLVIAHAYFIPVTFNDPAMPIIPPENMMEVATERLNKATANIRQLFETLQVTGRIEYGDIQDVLEDMVEELKPALVVSGSHGEDDAEMWMGSTTLDLLRHTKCPVLAVPPAALFKTVNNICLAVDFNVPGDHLPLTRLGQLQQASGAMLHLLHVATQEADAPATTQDTGHLAGYLQALQPVFHQVSTQGDVDQEIADFCTEQGMDWMAVIPHHHSFWNSLFHKSHTKQVVRVSHIPVLALHEEKT